MADKKVDKISLKNAVETYVWRMVWAGEPNRPIEVGMTYDDLKKICDMIDFFKDRKEKSEIE